MIYLIYGDNEFEKRHFVAQLGAGHHIDRYDGEALDIAQCYDLVRGQTLFAAQRIIVIVGLSENQVLWDSVPQIMANTDDVTIVLIETKVDKRTKTYKWLQKHARTQEYKLFGDRDRAAVVQWCVERATVYEVTLPRRIAEMIVSRLGHDQLRLDAVLQQLALMDAVTEASVDALLPLPQSESAFELFDAMVRGDRGAIHNIIHYLEFTHGDTGAYQTLGLLASQLTILAGLVLGGSPSEVARDVGAHPFAVKKLLRVALHIDRETLRYMTDVLAQADGQMKRLPVRPWLLIEAAIMEVVERRT